MHVESTLGGLILAGGFTGITLWVGIVAGVMLTTLTAIMTFLTLAPRFSDTWADRLGENTDREEAVDYRTVVEDETADDASDEETAAGDDVEPEGELESADTEGTDAPSSEPTA